MMSLMSSVDAETERRLLAAVTRSRAKIAAAKDEQQRAVIAALDAGISATVIGRAMGLSRHRVYQIRDGN